MIRTDNVFVAGHAVRLDVGHLSFSAKPVFAWDSVPRFSTSVADFPAFVEIVDFHYDESSDVLWLCDKTNGLFALTISAFRQ